MKTFLRNYVAGFFSPTAMVAFLFVLGALLIWRQKDTFGKILVTITTLLFLTLTLDPLSTHLLQESEDQFAVFDSSRNKELKFVVVIGGSILPNEKRPLTSQLTQPTLIRLIEGIRIHREIPGSLLVLSGKGLFEKPEAEAMKEMALLLGVKNQNIIIETESNNTKDHTIHLKKILKEEPFALVTSAIHMERAAGIFKKAGYKFTPAPADHHASYKRAPLPKGRNLAVADMWLSEFWARKWAELNEEL